MGRFTVIGAGLAGSLAAIYLARHGNEVEIHERRGDMRAEAVARGRSINLALSNRGIEALKNVGLADEILKLAIPMEGRRIHTVNGSLSFQPYGTRKGEAIYSVSREGLNIALMNAAQALSAKFFFHERCIGLNLDSGAVEFEDPNGSRKTIQGGTIIGADGAHSAVRGALGKLPGFQIEENALEWGYKELSIPAGPNGSHLLEKNALHIWPRREFMLIALPNLDGSFTCTLFLPVKGEKSFETISNRDSVIPFFQVHFPDAVPLMPTLNEDYAHNPVCSLTYVRCHPWHFEDRVVIIGDACHAVVPFYGQGMNAAFEDCLILDRCLREGKNLKIAFSSFEENRKPDTDALAELSLQNFVEMRAKTASPIFLWEKRLEKFLHKRFPKKFIPLYSMVTFSLMPYAKALAKAKKQNLLMKAAGLAILAGILLIWGFLFTKF